MNINDIPLPTSPPRKPLDYDSYDNLDGKNKISSSNRFLPSKRHVISKLPVGVLKKSDSDKLPDTGHGSRKELFLPPLTDKIQLALSALNPNQAKTLESLINSTKLIPIAEKEQQPTTSKKRKRHETENREHKKHKKRKKHRIDEESRHKSIEDDRDNGPDYAGSGSRRSMVLKSEVVVKHNDKARRPRGQANRDIRESDTGDKYSRDRHWDTSERRHHHRSYDYQSDYEQQRHHHYEQQRTHRHHHHQYQQNRYDNPERWSSNYHRADDYYYEYERVAMASSSSYHQRHHRDQYHDQYPVEHNRRYHGNQHHYHQNQESPEEARPRRPHRPRSSESAHGYSPRRSTQRHGHDQRRHRQSSEGRQFHRAVVCTVEKGHHRHDVERSKPRKERHKKSAVVEKEVPSSDGSLVSTVSPLSPSSRSRVSRPVPVITPSQSSRSSSSSSLSSSSSSASASSPSSSAVSSVSKSSSSTGKIDLDTATVNAITAPLPLPEESPMPPACAAPPTPPQAPPAGTQMTASMANEYLRQLSRTLLQMNTAYKNVCSKIPKPAVVVPNNSTTSLVSTVVTHNNNSTQSIDLLSIPLPEDEMKVVPIEDCGDTFAGDVCPPSRGGTSALTMPLAFPMETVSESQGVTTCEPVVAADTIAATVPFSQPLLPLSMMVTDPVMVSMSVVLPVTLPRQDNEIEPVGPQTPELPPEPLEPPDLNRVVVSGNSIDNEDGVVTRDMDNKFGNTNDDDVDEERDGLSDIGSSPACGEDDEQDKHSSHQHSNSGATIAKDDNNGLQMSSGSSKMAKSPYFSLNVSSHSKDSEPLGCRPRPQSPSISTTVSIDYGNLDPTTVASLLVPGGRVSLLARTRCNCLMPTPDEWAAGARSCGRGRGCLLGQLQVECEPALCPTESLCCNSQFRDLGGATTQLVELVFTAQPYGDWKLRVTRPISENKLICEVGGLAQTEAVDWMAQDSPRIGLSRHVSINVARDPTSLVHYVGRCAEVSSATVRLTKWLVDGSLRIGLFATRQLQPGDELVLFFPPGSTRIDTELPELHGAPRSLEDLLVLLRFLVHEHVSRELLLDTLDSLLVSNDDPMILNQFLRVGGPAVICRLVEHWCESAPFLHLDLYEKLIDLLLLLSYQDSQSIDSLGLNLLGFVEHLLSRLSVLLPLTAAHIEKLQVLVELLSQVTLPQGRSVQDSAVTGGTVSGARVSSTNDILHCRLPPYWCSKECMVSAPPHTGVLGPPLSWKPTTRVFFYHRITRSMQWDMPVYPWDANDDDDADIYDYNQASQVQVSHDEIQQMYINLNKIYDLKQKKMAAARAVPIPSATAGAVTSQKRRKEQSVEMQKKEAFKKRIMRVIWALLTPYHSSDCREGKIESVDDLHYLTNKLSQTIMFKELKILGNKPEQLEVTNQVELKTRAYVKMYMQSRGVIYKRPIHYLAPQESHRPSGGVL